MITEEDYLKAEKQYISLTDHEIEQLAKWSAEEQPALFTFVAAYYESLEEEDNRDFYIQLVYTTWIAYKNKYELTRQLKIEEIEQMDADEEKRLLECYNSEEELLRETLRRMTEHPQAQLIGHLYTQIGDFFGEEQLSEENAGSGSYHDAGIISGVMNSYINLLEKTRLSFMP